VHFVSCNITVTSLKGSSS